MMAARLPNSKDETLSTTIIICQWGASSSKPPTSRRSNTANTPSLGAVATNRVAAVGAPWYTSGTHI